MTKISRRDFLKGSLAAVAIGSLGMGMAASADEDVVTINMYTMGIGTTTDYKLIEDAINEISRAEIGVEVNWTVLDIGQWFEQYNLILSGSETVDLLVNMGGITTGVNQMAFLELEDLYAEYGQGIAEYLDEDFLQAGYADGHLYGIANQKDFAATTNVTFRQDIIDELGLDVSGVASLEDWTEILAAVHEAYPDMYCFVSNGGSSLNQFDAYNWDKLGDRLGVLLDYGETAEVVNLYESEQYESICRLMREWYEAGYVAKDTATSSENYGDIIKAGKAFCSITTGNPGTADEATTNTGYPMGTIALTEALSTTSNVTTIMWSIPYAAAEPEAAMKFLNLMYTNSEVSDLLNYGIEGTHYQVLEDGTYDYVDGEDGTNNSYHPAMTWIWPNTYIGGDWTTSTIGLGEKMTEFNKNARRSMYQSIRPGQVWLDTEGKRIQAHGGSILAVEDTFYWYGENKEKRQAASISGTGASVAIRRRTCTTGRMRV
ncbi:MAG: extracellular solute-binding protein [Lachnospiraceae bacterium]|nr:extracellular solute-binding protein [Lachnospiraceae bacterium]